MNRFDKNIKLNILLAGIILITSAGPVLTQSTVEMDRQAQEYFDNKDFSKAVALWLNILDIEPENQEIQKKVEFLYEMKQKKDLELEKAKLNYKLAKKDLAPNFDDKTTFEDAEKNLDKTKEKSKIAFASFITAYRIDPKDPEMQLIREDMQKLEKTIAAEDKRLKSSREIREKVAALLLIARAAMDESRFQEALKNWSDILKLMPEHLEATEGKRQAGIAIENILRYENIKKYMASGILFFGQEEYKPARQDFMSVLQLDPENSSARDYIEKIDDKLNEKKRYEQRLREAETFYASGRKNIRDNKYDEARDDLENALSLIENFKDARQLLLGLPGLKAEYDRERARKETAYDR
jgi:cytochrome c-type biogenesis protein CcmH/NrfG